MPPKVAAPTTATLAASTVLVVVSVWLACSAPTPAVIPTVVRPVVVRFLPPPVTAPRAMVPNPPLADRVSLLLSVVLP